MHAGEGENAAPPHHPAISLAMGNVGDTEYWPRVTPVALASIDPETKRRYLYS